MSDLEVLKNATASRWEARADGNLVGVADYEDDGNTVAFTHTFVEPVFRGSKVASSLIRAALDDARASDRKVVPACEFVETYIRRHSEYAELVANR